MHACATVGLRGEENAHRNLRPHAHGLTHFGDGRNGALRRQRFATGGSIMSHRVRGRVCRGCVRAIDVHAVTRGVARGSREGSKRAQRNERDEREPDGSFPRNRRNTLQFPLFQAGSKNPSITSSASS